MSVIIGPLNNYFCGIISQWNIVNKSFKLEEGQVAAGSLRNSVPTLKALKRVWLDGWLVGRGRLVGWSVCWLDLAFLASNL